MGIFFRDSDLKKTFKEAPKSDLLKDLASRIKTLIDFAYKRVDEVEDINEVEKDSAKSADGKKKEKGVAFIRQVWKKEAQKDYGTDLTKVVKANPLLELAKLYKVGLQANAGWFSDLPGDLIQKYSLLILDKLYNSYGKCGHNGEDMNKVLRAFMIENNVEKVNFAEDIDSKALKKKFIEEVKRLPVTNPNFEEWYKQITDKTKKVLELYKQYIKNDNNLKAEVENYNNAIKLKEETELNDMKNEKKEIISQNAGSKNSQYNFEMISDFKAKQASQKAEIEDYIKWLNYLNELSGEGVQKIPSWVQGKENIDIKNEQGRTEKSLIYALQTKLEIQNQQGNKKKNNNLSKDKLNKADFIKIFLQEATQYCSKSENDWKKIFDENEKLSSIKPFLYKFKG